MTFARQVSQALDTEHHSNLELLGRLEGALTRGDQSEQRSLAGALVRQLEHEIGRHFGFEEDELFPRMDEAGDGEMASLLRAEHEDIRTVAAELLPLARATAAGELAPSDQASWRRLALELIERMVSHIQKETMALLPLIDDLLDDDSDRELAFNYAAG